MKGPKGKYLFGLVKIGDKGQIVIPKEARDVFGLKPGDQLLLAGDEKQGMILVDPVHSGLFKVFQDSLLSGGAEQAADGDDAGQDTTDENNG